MTLRVALLALAACSFAACGGSVPPVATATPIGQLRDEGKSSSDGEEVGRWALAEMVSPGGDAREAENARKRLDKVPHDGLYSSLARALYDETHGDPRHAADAYVASLRAAQASQDPDAPLVAWFATHQLLELRHSVSELFALHRSTLEGLIARPGALGWRALAELQEWWATEVFDNAEATGDAYDNLVTSKMGCLRSLRLAGPFGHGQAADWRRPFDAERPGPWPAQWPEDPLRGSSPHQLKVTQHRCIAVAAEPAPDGVYYAETFFRTGGERSLIVAAQGALKVWVDDVPVLERDPRDWGAWQRYGAAVAVGKGRHRIVARLMAGVSSIRLLNLDGTAAAVETDANAGATYSLAPPRVLDDPNPIAKIVEARAAGSPLQALLAAAAAYADSLDDVASVLMEPIASPKDGAAVALERAAAYARTDPAYPEEMQQRTAKMLRERAVAKDPKLWASRTLLVFDDAEQRGLTEAVEPLRKLAAEFKGQPEVQERLARLYGRLGWRAERMRALSDLTARFPDDLRALRAYLAALDEDGPVLEADRVAARIKKLDPDAEVDLDRALARQDWKAAVAELERLGKRRPDRKEIAGRIADVLARSGEPASAAAQLDKVLAKNPQDAAARFRLADRAYAKGDESALRRALAEALQSGANGVELRAAIDLVEGATDLEPYRIDGRKVIREFEQWQKAGHRMEGNGARVLDYAATWVHPDGSSEMLEHEIQRIQSQEAINQESEVAPPTGLVLHLRVIKPDGSTLEPVQVSGKPTLTMPHLEVGDYVEMEHITPQAGDGQKGRRYRGPHWFFREADKGYWRSEFVAITPKDRKLEIETRGKVGAPTERALGTFVERRWRVDQSPPAPNEPDSPPPTEFLPSVRLGWGVSLEDTLARFVDAAPDDTPLDPRVRAIALDIVRGVPVGAKNERARRLYRWVVEHVQDGKESDGRRVVFGKAGSRQAAFQHLLRQIGIRSELAVVKNRLATPPLGKMSEVENYDSLVMRLETEKGITWLLVRDKFAPYGYVPAEMRGQPAFRLVPGLPPDMVPAGGALDAVAYEGRANVSPEGSAAMQLVLTFTGNRAIAWRNVFDKVPEGRLMEFMEKDIVGRTFDGGHVRDVKIENKADVDLPLVVKLQVAVPELARANGGGLLLKEVFPMDLSQLAPLPERQTPLLRRASWHTEVHFEVVFPDAMKMPSTVPAGEAHHGDAVVRVADKVRGHAIFLDRVVDLPAGRVQPGEEYAKYRDFVRDADALMDHEIVVGR